jgi:hypothetical protein
MNFDEDFVFSDFMRIHTFFIFLRYITKKDRLCYESILFVKIYFSIILKVNYYILSYYLKYSIKFPLILYYLKYLTIDLNILMSYSP